MITIFLCIFIGFPILISFLTYTLFCYEETNNKGQPLTVCGKLALRAAVQSICSEILTLTTYPLGFWPKLWCQPPTGSKPIVVLVHGLFHNPSAWIVFRYRLQAQGLAPACLRYSSWGAHNFEDTVKEIRDSLTALAQKNPEQEIHLLGHSIGGLLLRTALSQISDCTNIRTLITLGTPFQGSKLAPFALNSLGRYLWYQGPTTTAVAALPFPEHIQGHALWSPADNMVLPNSALKCEILGWKNHTTSSISHVGMLHSSKIFHQVLEIIQNTNITNRQQ